MTLEPATWLALAFAATCFYAVPLAAWALFTRRLAVPWRIVGLGSLTWLTALPFLLLVPMGASLALGGDDPRLRSIVWGVALSLTAGIAEESSRWWWYRRSALRDRRAALVAGLGHGGTEAWVLGLQLVVLPALMFALWPELVPPEMRDNAAIASYARLGGAARVLFLLVHVGLTLLVWRAVTARRPGLWLLAVLLHIGIDLLGFVVPVVAPGLAWTVLLPTAPLAVAALAALGAELLDRERTTAPA